MSYGSLEYVCEKCVKTGRIFEISNEFIVKIDYCLRKRVKLVCLLFETHDFDVTMKGMRAC